MAIVSSSFEKPLGRRVRIDGHAEKRAIPEPPDGVPVRRDEPRVVGHVVEPERNARGGDHAAEALAEPDPLGRHRLLGVAPQAGRDQIVSLDQSEADGLRLEHLAARRGDRPEQPLHRLDPRQLVTHVEERLESRLVGAPRLQELRVPDRDRRLRGQPCQQRLVPIGERPRGTVVDGEQPLDTRLRVDRHGQRRHDAFLMDQRLEVPAEARVVQIVVGSERTAGQQHLAAEALAGRDSIDGRYESTGPVANQHHLGRRVARGDGAQVRAAELARRLTYMAQDRVELERRGGLARELGENFRLPPPPLRVLEQPRLFDDHRRLVDEGLGQAHLVPVIGAALVVADRDGAHDPVVDDHRERERRPVRLCLERLAQLRRQHDPRIGEDIRRGDGAPGAHGTAQGPGPGGEHDVVTRAVGRDVPADERAADRVDAREDRGEAAEERAQAVGDPPGDLFGVERFRDEPPHAGQDLGLPLPARRLGVEPRVVERDRRLVHERLGEPDQDGAVVEVFQGGPRLGGERDAGVREGVGRGHRPPLAHRETDRRGAARERLVPDSDARARQHHEVSGVEADPVEGGHGRAEETAHAFDDALSDFVGLEGLRDEPAHFGQDLSLAAAGLRLGEETRVPDRDGGVVGQPAERRLVPVGERAGRAVADVQKALVLDGNDDLRDDPGGPHAVGVVKGDPRVLRVVRRPERASAGEDQATGALPGLDQDSDERVVSGSAPVQHADGAGAGLGERDLGAVGAGELAGAVDDPREDRREIERAVDLPDDLGEHLHFVASPGHVVEELDALQHQRGLIGEGLGQANLVLAEDSAFARADRERADHPVLDEQRQRQDRAVRGPLEALEDGGVVTDARVLEEVGRGDRPALAHREPDGAGPLREDRPGPQRLFALAHEREGGKISGFRNEPVERRLLDAEQGSHALHHAPRDGPEVEGLAAQAAELGERLGRAAAAFALREEPAIADRRRGLRDERLEEILLLTPEDEGLFGHEHQDADERFLTDDGQRVEASEALGGIPVAGQQGRLA